MSDIFKVVPLVGLEPTTYWLQVSCSTRWAKAAKLTKVLYWIFYLMSSKNLEKDRVKNIGAANMGA